MKANYQAAISLTLIHPFCVIAFGLLTISNPVIAVEPVPPTIAGITTANGLVTLTFASGQPVFQVQRCLSLGQAWENVGAPTNAATLTFPQTGDQAYYRAISDFTARYYVTFSSTWSQVTHPSNWPANAHFSGLVGGVHNSSVHFFRLGETASEGIRTMAELGSKTLLLSEVATAMTNGTAHFQLNGGSITSSPGSAIHTFVQPMRRDFPLVTLVSMIAPSPDWFVGVDSLSLIENDQWVTNKTVTLYGMDAGTDSGVSYSSPDQVTVPRGMVTEFADFPALVNGAIVPFATFTFTRY